MKIKIQVKTKAREEKIEKRVNSDVYVVHTKKQAIEGEANRSIVEIIAEYFNVPKTSVVIKSGKRSKLKIVEITGL